MVTNSDASLKALALTMPGAVQVFESHRLDYGCSGYRSLDEACRSAGLRTDTVIEELEAATAAPADWTDWSERSLEALIAFILDTHHVYTRRALRRIPELLNTVVDLNLSTDGRLQALADCWQRLAADLEPHLLKEEQVLFPYAIAVERARCERAALPEACFGHVIQPIAKMHAEHDTVGELLKELVRLTGGFIPPAEASGGLRLLYVELDALSRDLMRHIHLENHVLFPSLRQRVDGL